MLTISQHVEAGSNTGSRGSAWIAEATVEGTRYEASSRSGAPFALARVLVGAGVPDQPVIVTHEGLRGHVAYRSLHRMAGLTIAESASHPVHLRKWSEFSHVSSKTDGEAPAPISDTPEA